MLMSVLSLLSMDSRSSIARILQSFVSIDGLCVATTFRDPHYGDIGLNISLRVLRAYI